MSSENTICLIRDFPITRTCTHVDAKDLNGRGNSAPDDISKSSELCLLTDYIQEILRDDGHTVAFIYMPNNDCSIYIYGAFSERLCSIFPNPFLQIKCKEEVPSTEVVDRITIEAKLDLTKIVRESHTATWIKLFSHASIGCKADVTLGWVGPPITPIGISPTSTRVDFEGFILNLFEKESSKDLAIVAGNGAEIRCHRMVFEAHSDVLSAMVSPNNGMKEAQSGRVEMLENSEEGLSHLIRYLYGMELKIDELSCDVAIELFKTAHKYKLTDLLKWFGDILVEKGSDWYTPDDLMDLYFHVKNLVEFKAMEDYILSIMLSLSKEIRSCDRLKELKRTDPDAAFDLMSTLFDKLAIQK